MAREWREVKVHQLKAPVPNALVTGPFGSNISSQFFRSEGVPVIRGSNLSEDIGTRFRDEDCVFVTNEKAVELRRCLARHGDLIFTCWGTINQVGLLDARCRYAEYLPSNKQMKLTPDPKIADSLFLYYLFSGPEAQDRIQSQAIGSSVPGFNLGQLSDFPVVLPSLPEQQAIARILGTLDDKIELNRQMNATLEGLARAVFRSWFVDFDPVVAKAAGRRPVGMTTETAALFPDTFEDSPLGPIPKGWRAGCLDDVAIVIMGTSPPGTTYNEVGIGTALINGPVEYGDFFTLQVKWTTAPTRLCRADDLIFCVRGSTTGRRVVADGEYCLGRGVCAIRAKDGNQAFVDLAVECTLDDLLAAATGSTFPSLNSPEIRSARVILPHQRVLDDFGRVATPLWSKMRLNAHAIQALAALRDTLLPRLLSGELRLKDAERAVGEAT